MLPSRALKIAARVLVVGFVLLFYVSCPSLSVLDDQEIKKLQGLHILFPCSDCGTITQLTGLPRELNAPVRGHNAPENLEYQNMVRFYKYFRISIPFPDFNHPSSVNATPSSADVPSPSVPTLSTDSPMGTSSESPLQSGIPSSSVVLAQHSSNFKTVLIAVLVTAAVTSLIAFIIFSLYHKLKPGSRKRTENTFSSAYDNPLLDSDTKSHTWKFQGGFGIPINGSINNGSTSSYITAKQNVTVNDSFIKRAGGRWTVNDSFSNRAGGIWTVNDSFINRAEGRFVLGSPEWVGPNGLRAARKSNKKESTSAVMDIQPPEGVASCLCSLPLSRDNTKLKRKPETELVEVSKFGGFWPSSAPGRSNISADVVNKLGTFQSSALLTVTKASIRPSELSVPKHPSTILMPVSQTQDSKSFFADVCKDQHSLTVLAAEFAPADDSFCAQTQDNSILAEKSKVWVPSTALAAAEFAPADDSFRPWTQDSTILVDESKTWVPSTTLAAEFTPVETPLYPREQDNAIIVDVSQVEVPLMAAKFAPSKVTSSEMQPSSYDQVHHVHGSATFAEKSQPQEPFRSLAAEFAPGSGHSHGSAISPRSSTKLRVSGVSATNALTQQPQRNTITPPSIFAFTPQAVPPLPLPPALVSAAIVKAKENSASTNVQNFTSSIPVKAVAAALTSELSQAWRKPAPSAHEFLSSVHVKTIAASLDNQALQALEPLSLKQPTSISVMENPSVPFASLPVALSGQHGGDVNYQETMSMPAVVQDVEIKGLKLGINPFLDNVALIEEVLQPKIKDSTSDPEPSTTKGHVVNILASNKYPSLPDNLEISPLLLQSSSLPLPQSDLQGNSPSLPSSPNSKHLLQLISNIKYSKPSSLPLPLPLPPSLKNPPPPPPPSVSLPNGHPPPPPPPPPPTPPKTLFSSNVKVSPSPPPNGPPLPPPRPPSKGPPPPPLAGPPRAPAPPPAPGIKGPPPPPASFGGLLPPNPRPPPVPQTDNALKLKPLHWDKVRADPSQSMVWDKLKSGSFQLNEDEIALLFGQIGSTNIKTQKSKASPAIKKGILDAKKAQNIAIQLRALNISTQDICDALLEGDCLSCELLEVLVRMAPAQEEQRALLAFQGDKAELGPAERFLKAVLEIPNAFQRLDAMKFKASFKEELAQAKELLYTLEVACTNLRESRIFLKILEAVLKTGNRMNKSTNRGDAEAFKLDALLKLTDVKSENGKTTLLHWVMEQIIKAEGVKVEGVQSEEATQIDAQDVDELKRKGLNVIISSYTELESVKRAAGIDADALAQSVLRLVSGLSSIQTRLKSSLQAQSTSSSLFPVEDSFAKSMETFCLQAAEEVVKLKQQHELVLDKVKKLTAYYHGNLRETQPLRVFMIVRDFLFLLEKVCMEMAKGLKMTVRG